MTALQAGGLDAPAIARVQYDEMSTLRSKGGGAFWAATTGPTAWHASQRAHEQFDRLSEADPGSRSRGDICIRVDIQHDRDLAK